MRISVPSIPQTVLSATSPARTITPAAAIERITTFLSPGNVACIAGAGVSVDSGIRAYRGHNGRYLNPNYKCVLSDAERIADGPDARGPRDQFL